MVRTRRYLARYAEVAAAGVNRLKAHEQFGFKEGRNPSASSTRTIISTRTRSSRRRTSTRSTTSLQFGIYEGAAHRVATIAACRRRPRHEQNANVTGWVTSASAPRTRGSSMVPQERRVVQWWQRDRAARSIEPARLNSQTSSRAARAWRPPNGDHGEDGGEETPKAGDRELRRNARFPRPREEHQPR
jgi:hypothetical protein